MTWLAGIWVSGIVEMSSLAVAAAVALELESVGGLS